MKRTKIVATIGPASQGMIRELALAGANVVRLNMSHGSKQEHKQVIDAIKKMNAKLDEPVAIMIDTQGPKIRVGEVEGGRITLADGSRLTLTTDRAVGTHEKVTVSHPSLASLVKTGDPIFLADGMIELKVLKASGREVQCTVVSGGELGSRKGVNIPGAALKLKGLTKKDVEDIAFAADAGADFVAVSFVTSAADVLRVKDLLKRKGVSTQVVAKIETREAVGAIDEIIRAADAVMVARGDLGVQLPVQEIPIIQKEITRKCNAAAKPVIIATQMLESMVRNPRPTRAEVTDVANAILDGADAVMLSEETASGENPLKAVKTMACIAEAIEEGMPEKTDFVNEAQTIPEAVGKAVSIIADQLCAKAILTYTTSGSTARFISRYRPHTRIIGVTQSAETIGRLQLVWGVRALAVKSPRDTDEMIKEAVSAAEKQGLVKKGDLVVITAGIPFAVSGNTNLLKVHVV